MRRLPGNTFDKPWLLLCEGEADKKFFDRLIRQHNIFPDRFDVHFPCRHGDNGGGRGKFGAFLETTYRTSPTFRDNVKAVLIVSDNDDDMAESFRLVRIGLEASGGFGIPETERVIVRAPERPDIMVLMVPMGETGNLETICVRAAVNKFPIKPALETYMNATPAANWRSGKQAKMQMHALLAATCETNPDTSFAHHWQEREEFHIPITDDAFTEIILFLLDFENAMASA